LLAEDNIVSQRVGSAMIENFGLRVDVVGDGLAAVRAATRTRYAAILMDCQIPVLDGYAACRQIRLFEDGLSRTPIIAVTASPNLVRVRCLAAGMDGYVAKPLSLHTLTAALSRFLPPVRAVAGAPAEDASELPCTPDCRAELSEAVFDRAVVGRLERLGAAAGEDLIGQLSALFLADAGQKMTAIRQSVMAGASDAVAETTHSLSGASANLGATVLVGACEALGTDYSASSLTDSLGLVAAIERELERVCTALHPSGPIA
jgi:CheY-like chemotaxis protein/HPt (histidine-containing phosphotransfer) domain-containing protein